MSPPQYKRYELHEQILARPDTYVHKSFAFVLF